MDSRIVFIEWLQRIYEQEIELNRYNANVIQDTAAYCGIRNNTDESVVYVVGIMLNDSQNGIREPITCETVNNRLHTILEIESSDSSVRSLDTLLQWPNVTINRDTLNIVTQCYDENSNRQPRDIIRIFNRRMDNIDPNKHLSRAPVGVMDIQGDPYTEFENKINTSICETSCVCVICMNQIEHGEEIIQIGEAVDIVNTGRHTFHGSVDQCVGGGIKEWLFMNDKCPCCMVKVEEL